MGKEVGVSRAVFTPRAPARGARVTCREGLSLAPHTQHSSFPAGPPWPGGRSLGEAHRMLAMPQEGPSLLLRVLIPARGGSSRVFAHPGKGSIGFVVNSPSHHVAGDEGTEAQGPCPHTQLPDGHSWFGPQCPQLLLGKDKWPHWGGGCPGAGPPADPGCGHRSPEPRVLRGGWELAASCCPL